MRGEVLGSRKGAKGTKLTDVDVISRDVVTEAIRIHRELGPGLLESVYEMVLAGALGRKGYGVERQKPIDVTFDGMTFEAAFRVDILVENSLVLEIKSVERINAAHAKQLLTYLRLLKQPVGLLLNFSGETMKEGIRRMVNNHHPHN
jgi:GxxExxY protein